MLLDTVDLSTVYWKTFHGPSQNYDHGKSQLTKLRRILVVVIPSLCLSFFSEHCVANNYCLHCFDVVGWAI